MSTANFEDEEPSAAVDGFAPTSRIVSSLSEATGVLIVDISNLAHRSLYAYKSLTAPDGKFSGHVFGSARLLLATIQNHVKPGKWCIVFCYDGEDAKRPRLEILPTYKGNRDPNRYDPLPDVVEMTRLMPGIHISHPEREGDDAIAWAAEKIGRPILKRGGEAVILSSDRDLWTLLGIPGLKIFSPQLKLGEMRRGRYVEISDIEEEYLVRDPARIPFAKAVFGDSDNIKGVHGLRKAHVAPHLNQMAIGDVQNFMDLVELAPKTETSLNSKAKVLSSRTLIERNLKLVTAMTSGFDATNVVKNSETSSKKLEALFERYGSKVLVSRVEDFFGADFYVEEAGIED
jgi:DNA polymerase-1